MTASTSNDEDWVTLLAGGATSTSLRTLLKDNDLKAACLRTLEDAGCRPPANFLVLFCLDKALQGASVFIGKAAGEKLRELADRVPIVSAFLSRLAKLSREAKDKSAIKKQMLADLKEGETGENRPQLDEAMSFEVLTALHHGEMLEGLDDDFHALFEGLQGDLAEFFDGFYEPTLGWNIQTGSNGGSAADAIRYNSGRYDFVGRTAELNLLTQFLGNRSIADEQNAFKWLLITGSGGEGKTRLALEFTLRVEDEWKAGRLARDDLEKFDAAKWRPRQPMLVVIDYPAQNPEAVGLLLANLQRHAAEFSFPVRLLLLEREAKGDWFHRVFPEGGDTSAIRSHCFRREMYENGWELPPLRPEDITRMMRGRFEAAGLEPPENETLILAAWSVDRRAGERDGVSLPRPLFAAAAAELMVLSAQEGADNYESLIRDLDREKVLQRLIERDRASRWKAVTGDPSLLQLHENLLALVTMCLGLDRSSLIKRLPDAASQWLPDFGPKGSVPFNNDLMGAMTSEESGHFRELEPDILGEFFVFETLNRPETQGEGAEALRNAAFALGGVKAGTFALRCFLDFRDRLLKQDFLAPSEYVTREAGKGFAVVAASLCGPLSGDKQWVLVDTLLDHLDRVRAAFPEDQEIALAEAVAVRSATGNAAKQQFWDRVDKGLARLDALREGFPTDQEIAAEEGKAAKDTIGHAANEQRRDRVDAARKRINRLRIAFPNSPEIAFTGAQVMLSFIISAAEQQQWDAVDAEFGSLDKLRSGFPDDPQIAEVEAAVVLKVVQEAGSQQLWDLVDAALARLDAVRAVFPENQKVALTQAAAAFFVTDEPEAPEYWEHVDRMLERLDTLRREFTDDQGIALHVARAVTSLSVQAMVQKHWKRVDAALDRLNALQSAFPDDPNIALHVARALQFLTKSEAPESPHLDAGLDRLARLRATFPDAKEIAQLAAQAALAVVIQAGLRKDWKRLDTAHEHIRDLWFDLWAGSADQMDIVQTLAEAFVWWYFYARTADREPGLEGTRDATQAAVIFLVSGSGAERNTKHELSYQRALEVISDAYQRFPDDENIGAVYAKIFGPVFEN